jgi:hypothetical protein
MANTEWPVKLLGMERINLRSQHYTKIEFEIDRGEFSLPLRLPMLVPGRVDDAAVVAVARSYLAHTLQRLAEQTANWKLTEEQFRELVPPQANP